MKKTVFCAALLAAGLCVSQSAMAETQSVQSVSNVQSIGDYEGDYNGTMDNITMRGKSYDSESATFSIEDGVLTCDFPQIGSMPGTITIDLDVNVDETTGTITATSGTHAGTLTVLSSLTEVELTLDSLTSATITDNGTYHTLEFTLNVSGSFLGLVNYPASVHFVGTKY